MNESFICPYCKSTQYQKFKSADIKSIEIYVCKQCAKIWEKHLLDDTDYIYKERI